MGWKPVRVLLALLFVLTAACSDDNGTNVPAGARYSGTFTLTSITDPVNGVPDTDAFNHLLNVPIEFTIAFTSLTDETTGEDNFEIPPVKYRRITTDGITFSFSGDPIAYLQKTVSPNFQDVFLNIELSTESGTEVRIFENFVGTPGDEYFGFEINFSYDGTVDAEGYPVLEDFSVDEDSVILRRYTNNPSFRMTDFATGTLSISFSGASRL
jgi:hypothetical protein